MSGMPTGVAQKSVMIDKVYTQSVQTINKQYGLTAASLAGIIPDGSKILSIKATNLSGRSLIFTVPSGSAIMLTQDAAASAPLPAISRLMVAPLSRFPVIKVNIPDLLAKPIDTEGSATANLCLLTTDGAADNLLLRFHVKLAI
jgi:hypothetical protein